jgi:hypothetical protein
MTTSDQYCKASCGEVPRLPGERAQAADPAPRNHFASRTTRFNTNARQEAEPRKATAQHEGIAA